MKRLILSLIIFGLAGCCFLALKYPRQRGSGEKTVQEILANPRQFVGTELTVSGTVENNYALMGVGYFDIRDGAGRSLAVFSERGIPKAGQQVTIHGRLCQPFAAGPRELWVLMEQSTSLSSAGGAP